MITSNKQSDLSHNDVENSLLSNDNGQKKVCKMKGGDDYVKEQNKGKVKQKINDLKKSSEGSTEPTLPKNLRKNRKKRKPAPPKRNIDIDSEDFEKLRLPDVTNDGRNSKVKEVPDYTKQFIEDRSITAEKNPQSSIKPVLPEVSNKKGKPKAPSVKEKWGFDSEHFEKLLLSDIANDEINSKVKKVPDCYKQVVEDPTTTDSKSSIKSSLKPANPDDDKAKQPEVQVISSSDSSLKILPSKETDAKKLLNQKVSSATCRSMDAIEDAKQKTANSKPEATYKIPENHGENADNRPSTEQVRMKFM